MRTPLLVAGCLRSGFQYITRILQLCGYDIQHENTSGKDGVVAWWVGHRYQDDVWDTYPSALWMHQVRHPLDTISSMVPWMTKHWIAKEERDTYVGFVATLPEHSQETPAMQAAALWLYLNQTAALRSWMTYRVETLFQDFHGWCDTLHIPWSQQLELDCRQVPRLNTSQHGRVTWEDLGDLAEYVKRTAAWYGYQIEG